MNTPVAQVYKTIFTEPEGHSDDFVNNRLRSLVIQKIL